MHWYLIGYRGSGKSTVGRLLGEKLGLSCVDTDRLIENAAGKSIQAIFKDEGEAAFRDLEQEVVAKVASGAAEQPAVISLGGGAILRSENQTVLAESGRCIWLTGSPDVLYNRIHSDAASVTMRPKLSDSDGYTEVMEVLAAREPIYRSLAQLTVNTDSRSPDDIVEEILLWARSVA